MNTFKLHGMNVLESQLCVVYLGMSQNRPQLNAPSPCFLTNKSELGAFLF